jgi:HEPN domain-containing protein
VKPETERWVKQSKDDLVMAAFARERGMYDQCVFHCQQALEKILKAIWLDRNQSRPHPRTHNLAELARQLSLDPSDDQLRFFQRLTEQYLPSHYADYDIEYPEEVGNYYYQHTEDTYAWLRQQLS